MTTSKKKIFTQTVYQFADATAANAFFTEYKTRWISCGTFAISSQGSDGKLTVTAPSAKSGVGQQDFAFTMIGA